MKQTSKHSQDIQGASDKHIGVVSAKKVTDTKATAKGTIVASKGIVENEIPSIEKFVAEQNDYVDSNSSAKAKLAEVLPRLERRTLLKKLLLIASWRNETSESRERKVVK